MGNEISVFIDDRERGWVRGRENILDMGVSNLEYFKLWKTITLELGDIEIEVKDKESEEKTTIIIEHKTLPDLCQSLKSSSSSHRFGKQKTFSGANRAHDQAMRLQSCEQPWYLITGTFEDISARDMKGVVSFLTHISLVRPFKVVYCPELDHIPLFIMSIVKYIGEFDFERSFDKERLRFYHELTMPHQLQDSSVHICETSIDNVTDLCGTARDWGCQRHIVCVSVNEDYTTIDERDWYKLVPAQVKAQMMSEDCVNFIPVPSAKFANHVTTKCQEYVKKYENMQEKWFMWFSRDRSVQPLLPHGPTALYQDSTVDEKKKEKATERKLARQVAEMEKQERKRVREEKRKRREQEKAVPKKRKNDPTKRTTLLDAEAIMASMLVSGCEGVGPSIAHSIATHVGHIYPLVLSVNTYETADDFHKDVRQERIRLKNGFIQIPSVNRRASASIFNAFKYKNNI